MAITLVMLTVGGMSAFLLLGRKAEPSESPSTDMNSVSKDENLPQISLIPTEGAESISSAGGDKVPPGRKEAQDQKDSEMLAPASLEDFIELFRQDRLDFTTGMSYLAEFEDGLNLVELRSSMEGMANSPTQKSILLLLMVKSGAIDDALRFVESDNFINESVNYLVLSVYGDALLQTSRYQESLQSYQRAFDILQQSQEEDRSVKLQLLKQNIDRVKARIAN